MNELKINGFSAVAEKDLIDVNGGAGIIGVVVIAVVLLIITAPPLY